MGFRTAPAAASMAAPGVEGRRAAQPKARSVSGGWRPAAFLGREEWASAQGKKAAGRRCAARRAFPLSPTRGRAGRADTWSRTPLPPVARSADVPHGLTRRSTASAQPAARHEHDRQACSFRPATENTAAKGSKQPRQEATGPTPERDAHHYPGANLRLMRGSGCSVQTGLFGARKRTPGPNPSSGERNTMPSASNWA